MIDKVVIPAAGNGTRLWPIARNTPKELLKIGEKPMIDYAIEEGLNSGIKKFGIIINEHKESIKEYLNDKYNQQLFRFFYQPEPLGLGDAIRYAKEWVSDFFAVILPDDIIISKEPAIDKLKKVHMKYGGSVIGMTSSENTERYGTVIGEEIEDGVYMVKDLIEKPKPGTVKSNTVIAGRYVLTNSIFKKLNGPNERTGEIELTDALKKLLEYEDIYAIILPGRRFDCGNEDGIREYLSFIKRRIDPL